MAYSLVCAASFNQSHDCLPQDARGRQCVPTCLMFLVIMKDRLGVRAIEAKDLHNVMFAGSLLYCAMKDINSSLDLVDPNDLPPCISFQGVTFYIKHSCIFSGFLGITDQTDYINIHTLHSALVAAISNIRHKHFLLLFTSISLSVVYKKGQFYIFDSHSRNEHGLSCADGVCVLGTVPSVYALCEHIISLATSCGVNRNMPCPFVLHAISIVKYPDVKNSQHYDQTVKIDLERNRYLVYDRRIGKCLRANVANGSSCSKRQRIQTNPLRGRSFINCLDDVHVQSQANATELVTEQNSNGEYFNPSCPKRQKLHINPLRGRSFINCVDDLHVQSQANASDLMMEQNPCADDFKVFMNLIQNGPDFVCSCCTQTFFKHSVVAVSRVQAVEVGDLERYLTGLYSVANKEWICNSCLQAIKKKKVPSFWVKNGLQFPKKPNKLQLSNLEERLVSPRLPFMQLREMPRGGQVNLKGNIVNVPADVNSTIKSLPRLVSDTETIMVKLKRKLSYKHHVAFENIRPNKVFEAAKWLVRNSALFRSEGIVVDELWLQKPGNFSLPSQSDNSCDASFDSFEDDENSWTEIDNFSERPTGNQDTFLQSVDFRDFNQILSLAPGENNSQ